MPTYVYRCAKCGDNLEVFQSFHDTPLKRHNGGCGGKLAKVMAPVGIVLKGSGFYKNDSGSKKSLSSRSESSSDSSSSDSSSSDSSSSESSSGSSSSADACSSCPSKPAESAGKKTA
ncbi:MAG: FmdB family transcriptional regulator [Acidimicrobiia bacterium]|nr:FmdB family transcriptional regulator [Acidimicrobiia bacterium]